jgi:Ca2+-binding EF-hand superfamily protein
MAHRHIALLALTTALAAPGPALAQQGGEDDITPCEGGFYLADEDRDGTITAEELEKAALADFARFDTDGSGDVTEAEYEACANAGAGVVGVPAQRIKSNLPEYDTNGDGQLSQQEFMNAAGDAYDQARIEANLDTGEAATLQHDADAAGPNGTGATSGGGAPDGGAEGGTETAATGDAATGDGAAGDGAAGDQIQTGVAQGGDASGTGTDESPTVAGDGAARGDEAPVVVLRRFLFIPEAQADRDPARMAREEATQRAMQMFGALDRDRSGQLDPAEWAQSRAVRQDLSDLLTTRFNRDDIDESGTLTPQEYVEAERRRWQQAADELKQSGGQGDGGDGQDAGGDVGPPVVYYRYPHMM